MIILKIILLVLGFLIGSFWAAVVIAAGVRTGLKSYFEFKSSKGGN